MENTTILKHLVQRETELERTRTRKLATQQWAAVIETEAKIEECSRLRAWLVEQSQIAANSEKLNPSPTVANV